MKKMKGGMNKWDMVMWECQQKNKNYKGKIDLMEKLEVDVIIEEKERGRVIDNRPKLKPYETKGKKETLPSGRVYFKGYPEVYTIF